MIQTDLLVIGAGPAGSAAAIEAASHGHDVAVIDKATFPRDKCCGDGLTSAALDHLGQLGVDLEALASFRPIDGFTITSPTRVEHRYRLAPGHGAVVRRTELDHALVNTARYGGARVYEQSPVEGIDVPASGPVSVTAGGKEFRARYVIAADGMWSPTRRMLAQSDSVASPQPSDRGDGSGSPSPRYLGDWHAFRQYFRHVSPRASDTLMIWFEPDLLPGYVWSFPEGDGAANVGFGIHRGHHYRTQDMGNLWPAVLARPHIARFLGENATPESPHKAWPIPARLGRLPLSASGGRVLFAGDAAAVTDPLTGEGIGQALETGRLAARSLIRSSTADEAASSYERLLRLGMGRDHAMARAVSKVLARRTLTEWGLRLASATDWTAQQFALWLFESYPRATVFNPRRWYGNLGG